jgi:hypothetical protein
MLVRELFDGIQLVGSHCPYLRAPFPNEFLRDWLYVMSG